jgi:hypothetical protein
MGQDIEFKDNNSQEEVGSGETTPGIEKTSKLTKILRKFKNNKTIRYGVLLGLLLVIASVVTPSILKNKESTSNDTSTSKIQKITKNSDSEIPTNIYTVETQSSDDSIEITKINIEELLNNDNFEVFSTFTEYAVDIQPRVQAYSVGNNLEEITNTDDFSFSEEQKNKLVENLFVVETSGGYQEFFEIYEANRYSLWPSFITTDAMLHNYHLMFNHILEELEKSRFSAILDYLSKAMLNTSIDQYEELKGTEWENAVKRNVGFFTVGSILLDPNVEIPEIVNTEVQKELENIEKHEGPNESAVMNIGANPDVYIETPQGSLPLENLIEDYSQYIPRGHYTKAELLKAYFKSMMWYGRLTFRFKNDDEIKSALLITYTLNQNKNDNAWKLLYEPINFFVGESDDITFYDFNKVFENVYGKETSLEEITSNTDKFNLFVTEVKKLSPPQINSTVVFEAGFQPDREKEIMGFRFLGQRYTLDASIFQRLMYREVGDKTTDCASFDPELTGCLTGARCLPTGLDIPATLGSVDAKKLVKEMGETDYACYQENMTKTSNYISNLSDGVWQKNLYWGWLNSLRPLTKQKTSGYPPFMLNSAWSRKELNTFLGSWTELKHDTILYAKQAYAELGGGGPPEKDFRGYVEPNPYIFARLASLVKMTMDGLENSKILDEKTKQQLELMLQLATSLKTISEKELNNEALTEEEYDLIKSFGGQLEHLWKDIFDANVVNDQNSAPLVADVATDPNGYVLEEATGNISVIYVVVPVENGLRIARGGVYSYYEFKWPMSDRLTDEKWKQMLQSQDRPTQPEWTKSFTSE